MTIEDFLGRLEGVPENARGWAAHCPAHDDRRQSLTADTAPVRLLRLPDVLDRVALGRSAWYAMVAAGQAPQPVRLGTRCTTWVEHEVDAWVRDRIAERAARAGT